MASKVNLAEFMTAYLAEAEEHLAVANARALAIEAALASGRHDPRAVRDLFRTVHTIKGLSSMVGVEPVVTIAHHLESALRATDRDGGNMSSPDLDTVFEALRAIERRVRALSRNEPVEAPAKALLERLTALRPETLADGPSPTRLALEPEIERRLAPFEAEQLRSAQETGRRALRVDFVPSPERARAGLTIARVRENVGQLAEIVKVVPLSAPEGPATPAALRFALLLVTAEDDAAIARAVGTEPHAVQQITEHPAAAAPEPSEEAEHEFESERRNVMRVDIQRVDEALEIAAGLLSTKERLARLLGGLDEGPLARELRAVLQETTRKLRDLRTAMLRIRTVPVADMLSRLPLVLRSARQSSGKQVRLLVNAAGAELDKAVAEAVFPALVHLLRNAVDHGIEAPPVRRMFGKPELGTVRIDCRMHSNRSLSIRFADDGAGIDRATVERVAGRPVTSDAELLDAICAAGVSTRAEVSTTSGRGMGMDIVHRIVRRELGGRLSLTTEAGRGTTFVLELPLTVAILDAFSVQCGPEQFVVPVGNVEEVVEIGEVVYGPAPAGGRPVGLIERRGETLPLIPLGFALGLKADSATNKALIVRRGSERIAFGLDRVLAQHEAVVRPLTDPLLQVTGISGSTDLGDGRATLVLDLLALFGCLQRGPAEQMS